MQPYSEKIELNSEPLVTLFENFISPQECTELMLAGESALQQALVSGSNEGVPSERRTGRNCWIAHQHNHTIAALTARISTLVNIPLSNAEKFQLIHYAQTQEYAPHFDAWDPETERGQRCMVRGGQRLVTCLLYLNTVAEGGGTGFPKLGIEVAAIQGRMLVFHNCHTGTNTRHPSSLHGGLPVTQGEKWACNLWFRERRFQP